MALPLACVVCFADYRGWRDQWKDCQTRLPHLLPLVTMTTFLEIQNTITLLKMSLCTAQNQSWAVDAVTTLQLLLQMEPLMVGSHCQKQKKLLEIHSSAYNVVWM